MLDIIRVIVLIAFLCEASGNSTLLSRRKRYLAFPPKANFVVTLALLKGIPYDIKPSPTTKIITTYECDVLFPLPRVPDPFRPGNSGRHRRHLHSQIEELLDMNGIDGRACLQAVTCHMKKRKTNHVEDLAEDFLKIIFGPTSGGGSANDEDEACSHSMYDSCTISMVDIVLDFAEHVYSELSKQINN